MAEESGKFYNHLPFTEGELKEIDIGDEETQELSTKGSKCLLGRLGVSKKIHRESFKANLIRIWCIVRSVFFKEIHEHLLLFEFSDDSDRRRVLEGQPWSYDRTLLILNEFDAKTPPSQMDFSFSPIWIQIHDMPLGCMSKGVGFKIGESMGKVEEVAIAADDVGWGKYLRVRVAINLYKPLERGRRLKLAGTECWVPFRYEKLPVFCYRCGRIIHTKTGCSVLVSKKHDEKTGWGPWIRAEELNCGSAWPAGSQKSCSDSPVKSSTAAETNMESLKDPTNLERKTGGTHGTVKPTAEISDANSYPCSAPNVNLSKEGIKSHCEDISNGRKRKNLEESPCPLRGLGVKCGSKGAGKGTIEAGCIQKRGLKTSQVYKPKSSIIKPEDHREPILVGAKKKTRRKGQMAPVSEVHTSCRSSVERTTATHVPVISLLAETKKDGCRRQSADLVVSPPIISANGSGGGSVRFWKRMAKGEEGNHVSASAPLFSEAVPLIPSQEEQSFTVENHKSRYALNISENGDVLAVAAKQPRQQQ
jgi:hypothetical protein